MNRTVLVAILSSVVCLAYFYMLDRLFFSSANLSVIFNLLLTVQDMQTAWIAVAICFVASVWNRPAPATRLVALLSEHPLMVALWSAVLIALGSIFVYRSYPVSMDEYAAVFQSKVFASGRLFAWLPPGAIDWLIVPGFNGAFLVGSRETGRVVEAYWPGYALLLAPFEFLGAPWLCNATLAALSVFLIYRITVEITGDRRAGGWAMVFTIASGAFLANAISYYSMQAHLTANLLFAWLLLKPTGPRVFSAGVVGSFALILHNPFPHALFALPWIVAITADKNLRRHLAPLILGYLPLAVSVGLGWFLFKSSLASGYHGVPATSALASGIFKWTDIHILNMRVAALAKMSVWAVPGLFVLAALGFARHRSNRNIGLLAQSAALTFVGYLFVNLDQGHGWGYRYFHSAWGVIPILAACAMTRRFQRDVRLESFVGAACVLSVLLLVPLQMHQIEQFVSRQMDRLPSPKRPGNNIFFINPGGGFYIEDMIQTDPFLREQDLLLLSHGSRADFDLMKGSWPTAVKIGDGPWGQQWYLRPDNGELSPAPNNKQWISGFCLAIRCPTS
jgi:hypothetical protein